MLNNNNNNNIVFLASVAEWVLLFLVGVIDVFFVLVYCFVWL